MEEEFNNMIESAMREIQGSSAYRYDRNRPYDGQPWTDSGIRGKQLISGVTMRDLRDCFVAGALDCCALDQPELYDLRDSAITDDIYAIDFSHIDPLAHWQNMSCRIEKMMGIFPNTPELNFEDILEQIPIIEIPPEE